VSNPTTTSTDQSGWLRGDLRNGPSSSRDLRSGGDRLDQVHIRGGCRNGAGISAVRAVGVIQFGGPDALEVLDLPVPEPRPGEVRIRVHAAAVNPSDLLFRAGGGQARFLGDRPPPFVPGMDAAGVIESIGDNAEGRLSVGDAVVVKRVEDGTLTLRVADVLPAEKAGAAHRRLEAGGVRNRFVLDFSA
jgi:alcohol dehydrogenase-like protein